MSNWIGRLQEEKNELALRLMKLEEFTSSPKGKELSLIDILLLKKQAGIMEDLLEILEERLAKIKADEEEDARMKNIVRNGNDGEHYLVTKEKERYAGVLNELEKEIDKMLTKELPKYYDEPETMTWHEATEKYENHPDYRLMTVEELKQHCKDETLEDLGGPYWSSSESDNNYAWLVSFNNGGTYNYGKGTTYRVRAVLRAEESQVDETEYLTSSKANAETLYRAMKEFDKSCDEHLDRIAETEITPKALLKLGFKEVYQGVDMDEAGYIYYTLDIKCVELCSTSIGEGEPLHVMMGYEGQYPIHNLRKLGDLILSLNELS